ncbi:ABC transporter ATP-binding protein [Aquibacillus kalidii]|uniref:ABC transporter ATP-binding protein n=1 Tax=Aquibacillus kalidii TaxID=2762597 RepID=UPI00164643CD|nr:ABC transporter ATP-binding protein [Aquibacillus kalidii]
MRKVFNYVQGYSKSMWIALFLMATELAVELSQPLIMAKIIDEGVVTRDLSTIIVWGSILLGLTLIAFTAGISSSFFASAVSQGVGHDLRRDLFSKVQAFSAMQMQKFSASTLLTRITNDVTQVQGLLFGLMRIMLRAPLFIFGGIILSFTVHAKLATVLLIVVPLLFIVMYMIMTKGISLFGKVQVKVDAVNSTIRENLLAIRLVKAFNNEEHEQTRFSKANDDLMEDNKKALRLMELTMPTVMLVMNLSMIILLWFGSVEMNNQQAQPGEIVAIINYATRIMGSFGVFSFLLTSLSRGRASASRISNVLESKAEEVESRSNPVDKVNGDIVFKDVSFTYPNAHNLVLSDLSFHIKKGQTVGVLGETGSGKTTLLHLIPKLYDIKSGVIEIDGKSLDKWGNSVRNAITLVPQDGYIFSGTIKENIAWGKEFASMDAIIHAAKEAKIHDFVSTLPDQYETVVGQRGVNLSGGQKQRLSIARALLADPRILLLDDSTSALDAQTESDVLRAIQKRACTTIVVAQKISSIIDADQIFVLARGKLVARGSHQHLMETSNLYKQIYQSQQNEEVGFDGK